MANLTVDITEKLILNKVQQGGSHTITISNVNDVYKRLVTIPQTSSATLATFKSTTATGSAAAMDINDVKYVRITNLSGENTSINAVSLGLQIEAGNDDSSADSQATIKLEAQKSFFLSSTSASINTNTSAGVSSTLSNVESIIAKSSGSVQLEVFIASS